MKILGFHRFQSKQNYRLLMLENIPLVFVLLRELFHVVSPILTSFQLPSSFLQIQHGNLLRLLFRFFSLTILLQLVFLQVILSSLRLLLQLSKKKYYKIKNNSNQSSLPSVRLHVDAFAARFPLTFPLLFLILISFCAYYF